MAYVTVQDVIASVMDYYDSGDISNAGIYNSLMKQLEGAQDALNKDNPQAAENKLKSFINSVKAQSGKHISLEAASSLIMDVEWILANTSLEVAARVAYWAQVVAPIVNEPVGYTNISLVRNYNDESVMGDIVTDSMLWKADYHDDGELNGSVDIAFTNPGGLRADITIPDGATLPYTITWGNTFDVLPFGNTLFLMDLTGAQIQELLDQAATLYKGILQTSGAGWYWYNDCGCNDPLSLGRLWRAGWGRAPGAGSCLPCGDQQLPGWRSRRLGYLCRGYQSLGYLLRYAGGSGRIYPDAECDRRRRCSHWAHRSPG
jgi:hypothetical protein